MTLNAREEASPHLSSVVRAVKLGWFAPFFVVKRTDWPSHVLFRLTLGSPSVVVSFADVEQLVHSIFQTNSQSFSVFSVFAMLASRNATESVVSVALGRCSRTRLVASD